MIAFGTQCPTTRIRCCIQLNASPFTQHRVHLVFTVTGLLIATNRTFTPTIIITNIIPKRWCRTTSQPRRTIKAPHLFWVVPLLEMITIKFYLNAIPCWKGQKTEEFIRTQNFRLIPFSMDVSRTDPASTEGKTLILESHHQLTNHQNQSQETNDVPCRKFFEREVFR